MEVTDTKSGLPNAHHYVRFLQIQSHTYVLSKCQASYEGFPKFFTNVYSKLMSSVFVKFGN